MMPPVPTAGAVTRVRCQELSPIPGDFHANVAAIETAILDAFGSGIELLVLPELATSGYYITTGEAGACSLEGNSGAFHRWGALLPRKGVVVVGFVECDGDTLYNSVAVITADGPIAVYRKSHLWDSERDLFRAGSSPAPVVDTPVGRLGILICYDLEFPEMPRNLALRGAEIIVVPTNWPSVSRPKGEHPPEVIQAMAAARASRVAIVCCDRRGNERGKEWTEGSTVVGPDGWRIGRKSDIGILDANLEIASERTRIGPRNDVVMDRRPELYSGMPSSRHGSTIPRA